MSKSGDPRAEGGTTALPLITSDNYIQAYVGI
jgi:hypothetical protein